MKIGGTVFHALLTLAITSLLIGIPAYKYTDIFTNNPDAVTQATLELPDSPSGEFVIFINKSLHDSNISDWVDFFNDKYAVIFDDVSCLAVNSDESALQLAERFRVQLPENQMSLRIEDGVLIASKLETGHADIVVMSKEMSDILGLDGTFLSNTFETVYISGVTDN